MQQINHTLCKLNVFNKWEKVVRSLMKKTLFKIANIGLCLFPLFSENAFALESNGSDGAFIINAPYTLSATNNQIFNFTDVNIGKDATLNFSGLASGDNIFLLASGEFNNYGIVNFSSNVSIFAIKFNNNGMLNIDNESISLASNINSSGFVLTRDSYFNDTYPGDTEDYQDLYLIFDGTNYTAVPSVPKPNVYLSILCGLGILLIRKNKLLSSHIN